MSRNNTENNKCLKENRFKEANPLLFFNYSDTNVSSIAGVKTAPHLGFFQTLFAYMGGRLSTLILTGVRDTLKFMAV